MRWIVEIASNLLYSESIGSLLSPFPQGEYGKLDIEYVTDKNGQVKSVVIPIDLWNKILSGNIDSPDQISEAFEDYCLNKAMDEGRQTDLLNRDEAMRYLEE